MIPSQALLLVRRLSAHGAVQHPAMTKGVTDDGKTRAPERIGRLHIALGAKAGGFGKDLFHLFLAVEFKAHRHGDGLARDWGAGLAKFRKRIGQHDGGAIDGQFAMHDAQAIHRGHEGFLGCPKDGRVEGNGPHGRRDSEIGGNFGAFKQEACPCNGLNVVPQPNWGGPRPPAVIDRIFRPKSFPSAPFFR